MKGFPPGFVPHGGGSLDKRLEIAAGINDTELAHLGEDWLRRSDEVKGGVSDQQEGDSHRVGARMLESAAGTAALRRSDGMRLSDGFVVPRRRETEPNSPSEGLRNHQRAGGFVVPSELFVLSIRRLFPLSRNH